MMKQLLGVMGADKMRVRRESLAFWSGAMTTDPETADLLRMATKGIFVMLENVNTNATSA